MADRASSEEVQQGLATEFERCSKALSTMQRDLARAGPLLDRELAEAAAAAEYDLLGGKLTEVIARTRAVGEAAVALGERIGRAREEWVAERRWTDDGLADLAGELNATLREDDIGAARRWLMELFDAIDAQELASVERIANAPLQWPERLRGGAERIARGVASWQSGDPQAGLELMRTLGGVVPPRPKEGLGRWSPVLGKSPQSRALRLAAWIALRKLGDGTAALDYLDKAVELDPQRGRMHAERAAYFLCVGDFDLAATDAQHAIENAGDSTNGYLELGTWSEFEGEFAAADDLYRRGLERMPAFEMARLGKRASLVDATGRLLARAAEELLRWGDPVTALKLGEAALLANVRGSEQHPSAAVHQLRSEALEEIRGASRQEAGASALQAGKLHMWNGSTGQAINQFGRAMDLDPQLAEAGWLLADALVSQSLPPGEVVPNADIVARAREAWESQCRKGPPSGETSWAYLTRAIISDLATQSGDGGRHAGIWAAITFVERALIHDDSDAQRWGYAAQYLRYAQLEAVALDAIDEGGRLSANDRRVLAERLELLARRGPLGEAESVAQRLITMYGHDPSISAVRAWLALRRGRWEEGLSLLKLPMAEGNDPLWYLTLNALCHLAGDDRAAAREACREMLRREEKGQAVAIDGTDKCQLATAAVMVGEVDTAKEWLAVARRDPTTPAREEHAARAWLEVAAGDMDAACRSLSRAVGAASSAVEIEDIERESVLRLELLHDGAARDRKRLAEPLRTARAERLAWLERCPPSADAELADALSHCQGPRDGEPASVAEVALLSVAGRRKLEGGDMDSAIAVYERLLGSFEPEASMALARAIRAESRQRAADGDVEGVRRMQERLIQLDAATPVERALEVASALACADRLDDARKHLREHLPAAADDSAREALLRRLGRLSLDAGDLRGARTDLSAALELARQIGNRARIGQLEVTLGFVALLESDQEEVRSRIDAAQEAWHALPAKGESRAHVVGELVRLFDEMKSRSELGRLVDDMKSRSELGLSTLADSIAQQWEQEEPVDLASVLRGLGEAIDSAALEDGSED